MSLRESGSRARIRGPGRESSLKKQLKSSGDKTTVAKFLEKVASTPALKTNSKEGRLLFAMDATASRQPTWDRACQLQSTMFKATEQLGGLSVQLCYYCGYKEFYRTKWLVSTDSLLRSMSRVSCSAGHTQIDRVLKHAIEETRAQQVQAVVLIGDAVEESPDKLSQLAGQLGILKTPVFVFQEGYDLAVSSVFRQIAHLSGGAYSAFDESSAQQLKELLSAVAVYASGGLKALEKFSASKSQPLQLLTQQLKS